MSSNQKNNFPRGSEWRKWDLHVHTPFSYHYEYRGTDALSKIIERINNSDIEVFAITDYFTIDGYKELVKRKSEINKVILPGIELRLSDSILPSRHGDNSFNDRPINIQIIFDNDPKVLSKIEEFIFSLQFKDFSEIENSLTKENIIRLGKQNNSQLSDEQAYKEGCKNIRIPKEIIEKKLREKGLRDRALIVLPYEKYGGIDPIDPQNDSLIKSHLTKMADIIESSGEEQIKFFLGASMVLPLYSSDGSKSKQFKNYIGKPKPCINCSDSHKPDTIGVFVNNKICWIKADPTFEGLKQIVYEPEDRVKIQEDKPEEKESYQIIKSVRFQDTTNTFTEEEIFISQNLTTIIGGKSTGKSILLREIARAINADEVKNRIREVDLKDYKVYKDGGVLTNDFVVKWEDDREDKRSEEKEGRKIIYIPQSYLNKLSDDDNEKTSPIDKLVEDILKEKNEDVYERLKKNERKIETEISELITDLFNKINDLNTLKEESKTIGDVDGLKKEIIKLQEQIEELQKKAGMSNEDIQEYKKLLNEYKVLINNKGDIEARLKDYKYLIDNQKIGLFKNINQILDKNTELKELFDFVLTNAEKQLNNDINNRIESLNKKLEDLKLEIEEKKKEILPLQEKVEGYRLLQDKNEKLKQEEFKLQKILEKNNKMDQLKQGIQKNIDQLTKKYSEFFAIYYSFREELTSNFSFGDGLELDIVISSKNKEFKEVFIDEVFDLRKLPDYLKEYRIANNEAELKNQAKRLIEDILNRNIELKKVFIGREKEIISKFLQNWFVINYKIKEGHDELSQMSPGKKSFVLLKLLIELDNSKCPILLDQPEDDLDNRSIYYDLVRFIRNKKKERQIIIVTHNPNLVVGADAELVIVANQDPNKSDNKKYQFEYIQGALENTFINDKEGRTLYKQGIQEHVCDILEGGEEAFEQRRKKYNF